MNGSCLETMGTNFVILLELSDISKIYWDDDAFQCLNLRNRKLGLLLSQVHK